MCYNDNVINTNEQNMKGFTIMANFTMPQVVRRGEIFYISSHSNTVGSEQKSGRPAVVVSNDINNEFSPCVEICYLTLKEKKQLPTHVLIDRGACINSIIICEQVTTVSKERVGDYMCTLPDDIMDAVDKAIITSLGLNYIIEQEINNSAPKSTSTIPMDKLKAENKALEAQNRELEERNKELTCVLESITKEADNSNSAKQEAELYKRMYNELLDRIIGKS